MDRRKALKNIGLGAGFLVATPTIISILQSCTNEPEFNPVFLSKESGEGHALRRMVDLIIPSDETVPGAVDVGVHEFIDAFWKEVTEEEDQTQLRIGWDNFSEQFTNTFGKEMAKGKPEEFDQLLAKYLKTSEEEQRGYWKKMGEFSEAYEADPSARPDPDAAMFALLMNIRGMTLWGWKESEAIGKNVLWYDPIPGVQKGCIDVSEANGDKVMAL